MMIVRQRLDGGPDENGLSGGGAQPPAPLSIPWNSAELQTILQTILEQLSRLVDCDACALLLIEADTLYVAASQGLPDSAESRQPSFKLSEHPRLSDLLRETQPVVVGNGWVETLLKDFTGPVDMRSAIRAPLLYRGRPVGLLTVLKKEPDFYSELDAQSTMAFASQAAMALENARLYAEAQRQALRLEAASQVGQKVTSILELNQLLTEVVRLIRETFGYYHVHLFLVDGLSNEIVLRECSGPAHESLKTHGLRLQIGKQGITGWVAETGQPLLCNDVRQEPRYYPHELLPETQAELAVPLRVGDVVMGILDVQSDQRDAFHADDVTALQTLADQVAIAIENAHLFEQTRHQYEAMRALHDISLDITSRLENEQVLAAILRQATHLLSAQGSALALCEAQADLIRLVAVHNVLPKYQGLVLRRGESAAGQAVATGKPVIINDYRHWAGRSPAFNDSPYDAVISVPLRWEGGVFGALSVLDVGERRPFTEDDVRLLSLFADLATIALKNAELHTAAMEFSQQLEQKVEQRTKELAQAREELARKADDLRRLLTVTIRVQEEERTRLARDLHDGSNQLITGALYELQAAQESIAGRRPEVALQKLEIAKGLLRSIEAENRRIISDLRPPILDAQGLAPALKWHVNGFQRLYGIPCALRLSGSPVRLSPETEIAVYRIIQEALNNVAAHARAQRVQIAVEFQPARLQVLVEDNGVGFDYEHVLVEAPGQMGLIGIRERAQSIGGRIEVQSVPGQGTRLMFEAPLPSRPTS